MRNAVVPRGARSDPHRTKAVKCKQGLSTSLQFPPTTTALHVSPEHTPHTCALDTDDLVQNHDRNLRQHEQGLEKLEKWTKQQNRVQCHRRGRGQAVRKV